MNFFDLIKARRKSGNVPTMGKVRRSETERRRHASGLCTACGINHQPPASTLCRDCEMKLSMDEIERYIQNIRNQILNKTQERK